LITVGVAALVLRIKERFVKVFNTGKIFKYRIPALCETYEDCQTKYGHINWNNLMLMVSK